MQFLVERALNVLIPRQAGIIISDLAEGRSPWRSIIIWMLLRCLQGYRGGLSIIRDALWQPVELTSAREITLMSFTHVLDLSMTFHNSKRTGEVMSVLERARSASSFLSTVVFEISPIFLDLGVAAVYLWAAYGPNLVWTVLVTGMLYLTVAASFQPTKNRLRSLSNEVGDSIRALKNESIANTDLVKYFSAERYEVNRFKEGTLKEQHVSYQYKIYDAGTDLAQHLIVHAGE
ncbi:MAG: hypothetical protein CYPHOPRED_002012 [Cyphobasidiales sp. Tagirdzhanova-0007]|nr:MAG: hypothetical protein CYPHOPRED_002012 [Cyphobasidiales sp. Tagirdzhanova-0007]